MGGQALPRCLAKIISPRYYAATRARLLARNNPAVVVRSAAIHEITARSSVSVNRPGGYPPRPKLWKTFTIVLTLGGPPAPRNHSTRRKRLSVHFCSPDRGEHMTGRSRRFEGRLPKRRQLSPRGGTASCPFPWLPAETLTESEPRGPRKVRQECSKMEHHIVTFVLAGGRGNRLLPLTKERAKPAILFGGKYRIIDFVQNGRPRRGRRPSEKNRGDCALGIPSCR